MKQIRKEDIVVLVDNYALVSLYPPVRKETYQNCATDMDRTFFFVDTSFIETKGVQSLMVKRRCL